MVLSCSNLWNFVSFQTMIDNIAFESLPHGIHSELPQILIDFQNASSDSEVTKVIRAALLKLKER